MNHNRGAASSVSSPLTDTPVDRASRGRLRALDEWLKPASAPDRGDYCLFGACERAVDGGTFPFSRMYKTMLP
jgi:hypothetical protein